MYFFWELLFYLRVQQFFIESTYIFYDVTLLFFSTLNFIVTLSLIICDNILFLTTLNSSGFFYILPCQLVLVKFKMDFWFILMVSLLTLFCPYQFKLIIYTCIVPYWIVFELCYNKNVKIWTSIVNWYQNKRCLSRCLINAHIWGLSFLGVLI